MLFLKRCFLLNINHRMVPLPLKVFLIFFETIFHQHLPFSAAIRISLTRVSRQVLWESVAMVTRWRHKSWVVKPFLNENGCFFPFSVKEHKMSTKSRKVFVSYSTCLASFFGHFSFWVKSLLEDVTDPQQRHNPQYICHLVEYITWLFIKGKIFSKYRNTTKTSDGGGCDFAFKRTFVSNYFVKLFVTYPEDILPCLKILHLQVQFYLCGAISIKPFISLQAMRNKIKARKDAFLVSLRGVSGVVFKLSLKFLKSQNPNF